MKNNPQIISCNLSKQLLFSCGNVIQKLQRKKNQFSKKPYYFNKVLLLLPRQLRCIHIMENMPDFYLTV